LFSTRRGGAMKGCLITLAILLVLAIAGGIIVAMNWKGWVGSFLKSGVSQTLAQSSLPQDQKDRINARVNSFADDFKNGKIPLDQLEPVFKEFAEGPLFPLALIFAVDEQHIKNASLTEEEKKNGRRQLDRFVRGVYEKKIAGTAISDVLAPVANTKPNGAPEIKNKVTAEELKQFFANAKTRADDAKVPDEDFKLNIADEVDKILDKVVKK
jgi:hypothetical protein